jgi:hypothetical protein
MIDMEVFSDRRAGLVVCLWGLVVCTAGCERPSAPAKPDAKALAQYGSLPGLRASHDTNLTDELARLQSAQATPEQLSTSASADGESSKMLDLGRAMNEVVSPKQVELVLQRIEKLYPRGAFSFDPLGLESLREARDPFVDALAEYRQLLSRPDMDFQVDLMQGLMADLSYVDQATFVHRLEAILAAEALANGTPAEAVFPLRQMLAVDARLSRLYHVVPRLTAAKLRAEALRVLEAIAQHPQTSLAIHGELYQLIGEQLDDWPDDAAAWIGDRAQGLHTYELIRDGYLTSIMSRSELDDLKQDRQFTAFLRAASETVDADQLYYLKTMRRVIQRCDEPYYRRKETLAEIEAELRQLEQTSGYPIIAAKFLLSDMARGHRLQAIDRARCEAWALALAASTRRAKPPFDLNPLTGAPYSEQTSPRDLTIGNIDSQQPTFVARVPRLKRE